MHLSYEHRAALESRVDVRVRRPFAPETPEALLFPNFQVLERLTGRLEEPTSRCLQDSHQQEPQGLGGLVGESNHVVFLGLLELGCGLGFWGHSLTSLGLTFREAPAQIGNFRAQEHGVL